MQILLIEDDVKLAQRTAEYLASHDSKVDIVGDGVTGLARARSGNYDIVLLDLMLPELDGLTLCRNLRRASSVPVIMLSARGDEVDRVVGLEMGADDYLPKPFSPRELLARVRAVLRRNDGRAEARRGDQIQVGPIVLDRDRRRVAVNGAPCTLTAHQFDLLWVLASANGRVLSRSQIHGEIHQLRGDEAGEFDPTVDRSIDVHMSKVRHALTRAHTEAGSLIRTIRGVGYMLATDGDG